MSREVELRLPAGGGFLARGDRDSCFVVSCSEDIYCRFYLPAPDTLDIHAVRLVLDRKLSSENDESVEMKLVVGANATVAWQSSLAPGDAGRRVEPRVSLGSSEAAALVLRLRTTGHGRLIASPSLIGILGGPFAIEDEPLKDGP